MDEHRGARADDRASDAAGDLVRILTWNLQGSRGLDVEGVAATIEESGADVLAIQEITRRQARRLATALGDTQMRWAFKNLSGWAAPEGLAVLTRHRLVRSDSFLLRRAWFWNWRRRIAIVASIERNGDLFGVINVHLSPHNAGEHRRREAHLVVERARSADVLPIITGDFNDLPGGPGYQVFTSSGWADAWLIDSLAGIDGSTNWTPGPRVGRPPSQRLDFVFAPTGWSVDDACVLAGADRWDWFAERSDHLPLLAVLRAPAEAVGR